MSFIATHSGKIYDTNGLYIADYLYDKPYCVKGTGVCIYNDDILHTAESIEDVCDEFVSVYEKYHDQWGNFKECLQLCGDGGVEIYGAIWTDKGLIFAAKYNSETKSWEIL